MCLADNLLAGSEESFRQLAELIARIYHFEFHTIIEGLKQAYAEHDPDTDTRHPEGLPATQHKPFVELLDELLVKANYERVSEEDLNRALHESSLFKIRLHVDFDDFSEVSLFARGQAERRETVPTWFGLRSRVVEFTNYERVVVYLKFRKDFDPGGNNPGQNRPGATLLKLFRNVPRADLEMLFPNTQVRMRLLDKLLIGVPAVISGGIVLTTKLGASLVLLGSLIGYWLGLHNQPTELNQATMMVLVAGAAALVGYLWKQFNNFKNRKIRFMQALTRNLYFKNLDNNAGVFYRLADDAEEEESKEALLAYYFLLTSSQPLTKAQLDDKIESWFAEHWDCVLDFEITDALEKLFELGLVEKSGDSLLAVPIDKGIRLLDQRWDDYFTPGLPQPGAL